MATHFAIGCKKWDEERVRGESTHQAAYTDPQVVYATRECPDKNASIVELQQRDHVPETHFRTEQKERFPDPGRQPKTQSFALQKSKVHFGNDTPGFVTSTAAVHHTQPDDEAQRAAAFRSAGLGIMLPNTVWDKPPRVHPITAGPRSYEQFDVGVSRGNAWRPEGNHGRITSDRSNIMLEPNVRNPVLGTHTLLEDYKKTHKGEQVRSTADMVEDSNREVPHLRSLGALRPRHNEGPHPGYYHGGL
jgi:hypothetical protein